MSHLKRRWKVLRANQFYKKKLRFISSNVSFRKTVSLKKNSMDIISSKSYQKYYYIRCIRESIFSGNVWEAEVTFNLYLDISLNKLEMYIKIMSLNN